MAKAPKKVAKKKDAKKVVANSTTNRTRISKPNLQQSQLSAECECCDGAAAYSMIYCEDGVAEHIPAPNAPSFLIYDAGALPNPPIFWCRPNSVPQAMAQELLTSLVASMDSTAADSLWGALLNNLSGSQLSTLAGLVASRLLVDVSCQCGEHSCTCQTTVSAS